MKKIFYIFLFTQFTISVYSQPHPTWQRMYIGNNRCNCVSICPADNNNYYLISDSWNGFVVKINLNGDSIWTRFIDSVDAYTGISSGDGGCVFSGTNNVQTPPAYGIYTVKLDSSGNLIWRNFYYFEGRCQKLIKTGTNNYILAGDVPGLSGPQDAFIAKVDSAGNLMWEKRYQSYWREYTLISEAHNTGYIVCGYLSNSFIDPGVGIISRVDESGNEIWEKKYAMSGNSIRFYGIYAINKGYLLGGEFSDPDSTSTFIYLLKIDTSGNTYFSRFIRSDTIIYNNNYFLDVYNFNTINSNRYLFNCYITKTTLDTGKPYIVVTDSSGNIIISKLFETQHDWSWFYTSYIINDNDFLLGGAAGLTITYRTYAARTDTSFTAPIIGIKKMTQNIPNNYKLSKIYPNPFNPKVKIKFEIRSPLTPLLTKEGTGVVLKIYDILGREVTTLVNKSLQPGVYEVEWDGSNYASGIYFCQFIVENYKETKRIVLLK